MDSNSLPQRRAYPSDVIDEEWLFCRNYLELMREDAPQREYSSRELFNAVRYLLRVGCPWRMLPHDLPPWTAVHQRTQRWMQAGCFEAMAHNLRALIRLVSGRRAEPSVAVLDSRTMQSTPESGAPAGYGGHKRHKGTKVHVAVATLEQLLAVKTTPADEQERAQVGELVEQLHQITRDTIKVVFADQGYTGVEPAQQAEAQGVHLHVVKHHEKKKGFVLLPRNWVVERSFAWAARFRRLARDYERLVSSLTGLHWLAFGTLMLQTLCRQSQ